MKNENCRILIVDDEFSVRDSLHSWFRKDGYQVGTAKDGREALRRFQDQSWDLVLLDLKMPDITGLEVQRRLRELAPEALVIMLTAHGTIDTAVSAMKDGAYDYITKPVDPDELSRVVRKALDHAQITRENRSLREQLDTLSQSDEIIGQSPQIVKVKELVQTLATNDTTVLIRGESGTGKELVARGIHSAGPRRFFSLVPVNCGALPESLLESELFGHEKGAFTGAQQSRKGKLELANGGTLFLDEIGCVSPKMQVELLRVLDNKVITRIGGSRQINIDFRVVCATNQDLEELVESGLFRKDLYFRINVLRIDLPPLRERRGDIPLLAQHLLRTATARLGKQINGFSAATLQHLKSHDWPGNVRELANVVERASVLCSGPMIRPEDLQLGGTESALPDPFVPLADLEKDHIANVLEAVDWNVSKAARALAIDRSTLYAKIKKYGLDR